MSLCDVPLSLCSMLMSLCGCAYVMNDVMCLCHGGGGGVDIMGGA